MSHNDTGLLEKFLQGVLHSSYVAFAAVVYPDVEDPETEKKRQQLIDKSVSITKKYAKEAADVLRSKNITTMESMVQNEDVVVELVNKIQKEMEKDAETLSKK